MNIWVLVWVSVFILTFLLGGIIGFIIYIKRVYKYRIRLYQNIGRGWQETKFYRARKIKVKDSLGESVLWIPKVKQYVSSYGELMGKNMYYYAEGEDGYWYNITLGDIDAKMGILDIEVVNRDVRGFHSTNQKRIKERYHKPKNWPMVMMAISVILALIIVFGGGYFLYGQIGEVTAANSGSLEAAKQTSSANIAVAEALEDLVSKMTFIADEANITIIEGETGIR